MVWGCYKQHEVSSLLTKNQKPKSLPWTSTFRQNNTHWICLSTPKQPDKTTSRKGQLQTLSTRLRKSHRHRNRGGRATIPHYSFEITSWCVRDRKPKDVFADSSTYRRQSWDRKNSQNPREWNSKCLHLVKTARHAKPWENTPSSKIKKPKPTWKCYWD